MLFPPLLEVTNLGQKISSLIKIFPLRLSLRYVPQQDIASQTKENA